MKVVSSVKELDLSSWLKLLALLAWLLMLYPLLSHPLPEYVPTSDAAVHYSYSFLISQDIENIGITVYQKLFHILVALISGVGGLSINAGMSLMIIGSSLLLPWTTYRLSLILTGHKEISLLSSFFSLTIIVYVLSNFGSTMPIPQSVALALIPLSLYLYVSRRAVWAGVTLSVHMMMHPSWPLAAFLIAFYGLLEFLECRKASHLKPLIITFAVAFLIYLPYSIYLNTHLIYVVPYPPVGSSSGLSVFSFLWIIWPPGVFLMALYACWRILLKKKDYDLNHRFIVLSFLIILLSTQAYLFGLTGPLVKVLLEENVTIIPERFLAFCLFFLSTLSAYSVFHLTNGRKKHILAVCLVVLLLSVPYYWHRYDRLSVKLSDSELGVMTAFQGAGSFNRNVFFNPMYPGAAGSACLMGGQIAISGEDAFMIMNRFKTFNDVDVGYVLQARNDSDMTEFVGEHNSSLEEYYSNRDYVIYEFTGEMEHSNQSLEDYARQYAWLYNEYTAEKYTKSLFERPLTLKLRSRDDNETICVSIYECMEVVPCGSSCDFEIVGSGEGFRYFFLSCHGMVPLVKGSLWLYNHGHISINPADDMDVTLVIPNKIRRPLDFRIFLYDVGVYVDVDADPSNARVNLATKPQGPFYKLSLRFFARTMEWVTPSLKYSYTIPNIVFGLPYAAALEACDQSIALLPETWN